jgi:hypothetical protein
LESTGDPVFSTIWTACGVPAITLPLLTGSHGLPIGVQLVGRRCYDGRLLRTARWLEVYYPKRRSSGRARRGGMTRPMRCSHSWPCLCFAAYMAVLIWKVPSPALIVVSLIGLADGGLRFRPDLLAQARASRSFSSGLPLGGDRPPPGAGPERNAAMKQMVISRRW